MSVACSRTRINADLSGLAMLFGFARLFVRLRKRYRLSEKTFSQRRKIDFTFRGAGLSRPFASQLPRIRALRSMFTPVYLSDLRNSRIATVATGRTRVLPAIVTFARAVGDLAFFFGSDSVG